MIIVMLKWIKKANIYMCGVGVISVQRQINMIKWNRNNDIDLTWKWNNDSSRICCGNCWRHVTTTANKYDKVIIGLIIWSTFCIRSVIIGFWAVFFNLENGFLSFSSFLVLLASASPLLLLLSATGESSIWSSSLLKTGIWNIPSTISSSIIFTLLLSFFLL